MPPRRRPRTVEASPPPAPGGDLELGAFLAWLGKGEVPPSVDRWVGDWLRSVGLARDPKAQGLLGFLDDAVSWGALASFAPFRTRNRSADSSLLKYAAVVNRPRELLQLWRAADAGFAARVRAYAKGEDPVGDIAALEKLDAHDDPEVRSLALLLRHGIPTWHALPFARRLAESGEDWGRRWLPMQGSRPPLWLRVAEPRHTGSVRDILGADGLKVSAQEGAALAVVGPTPIFRTRAWREGKVEVQDLASQQAGNAVPLAPGQLVWDACAGAGGKTMQLWSRLGGRGAVHASDLSPVRLSDLRKRLQRADARNVRVWPWDGKATPELPDEVAQRHGFDAVLVDAPCSGSGTWRRRPDARLRSVPTALPRWAVQQLELMDVASRAVRPGGALVYATCSAWVEENEGAVASFTQRRPGWAVERQSLLGAPDTDSDTLFVAVLRRG